VAISIAEARIDRWVALGIAEAQKGFRRVMGYLDLPSQVAAVAADDKGNAWVADQSGGRLLKVADPFPATP
jgi:hypothetical protein